MWFGIVLGWIILSILAGVGAKNKGRSFAGYFFLSLLLSPLIGLIAMAVAKPMSDQDAPGSIPPPDEGFFSKIVGVTKQNPDGTSRQELLKNCKAGVQLQIVREPENPVDEKAIAVKLSDGQQLGYLTSELADELAPKIDRGLTFEAMVAEITGGTKDKPPLGCNIKIRRIGQAAQVEDPAQLPHTSCKYCGARKPVDSQCPSCGRWS